MKSSDEGIIKRYNLHFAHASRGKPSAYKPSEIEEKWQKKWEKEKIYSPSLDLPDMQDGKSLQAGTARKPFYNLMMFPYPSAEGMHVGNMYAFTGADVYGRFKRMQGFSVFEPIGLDGFGIHSENYAIKVGAHPVEQAKISEKNFYRQLRSIGNGFDWTRTVETYKPEYYKWTQWLFIQLFKAGLAYRKKAPVNFCPSCKTVLADEQVIDGLCERCNSVAEKRDLEQWFFKITKYADRLLNGLTQIDWAEKVKIAQRLWIGKSEDTEITFLIKDSDIKITVVTTRADTLFGATFLVLAPEHELIQKLKGKIKNFEEVLNYIDKTSEKTELERGMVKDKTGVKLGGILAINPVSNEELPIYIADYVLIAYGTGAIMAVPAHDDRDFDFAKKFDLQIRHVIEQPKEVDILRVYIDDSDQSDVANNLRKLGAEKEYWTPTLRRYDFKLEDKNKVINALKYAKLASDEELNRIDRGDGFALEKNRIDFGAVYSGDGKHINSDFLNGLNKEDAIKKMAVWLKEKGIGGKSVHYHLRDWLISRQRYWGPPIPMIDCPKCGWQPVPEKDLPVELPFIKDYKPLGTGQAPLASHPEFYRCKCPKCGGGAKRETDVSDTFLDSAWYFLRYVSTDIETAAFDAERVKKWLPVNMYIGGAEHSVLHLLYARFITMALHDMGHISFEEPFTQFRAHGLIVKDGAKMSKSKGNVVVPDAYVKKFGADTLRAYLMFMGPYSQGGDFRDSGIEGMHRFLRRVWALISAGPVASFPPASAPSADAQVRAVGSPSSGATRLQMMHKTIKKVTEDIENLSCNTAIAALMEWYNFLSDQKAMSREEVEVFLKLLAPFTPHVSEELYQLLSDRKGFSSIHNSSWPTYDEKFLVKDEVIIVIQINGKLRGNIKAQSAKCKVQSYVEDMAKKDVNAARHLEGKEIRKIIYIEGKVLNFVIG